MGKWDDEEMREKMNTIINADCLEVMKKVPDNYFDLILTDPPYGIDINYFRRKNERHIGKCAKKGDYKKTDVGDKPNIVLMDEIRRVSKDQIIFGGNYFSDMLPCSQCWLVWDKDNGDTNFADCELAWTSFDKATRKYNFRWNGMLQQDMANKEVRHHPTQKPTELFKMILRDYAIKLDKKTVFDPFMGSGTTGIACKSLGLDWCGCELELDYCDIANKRLEKVQLSLF